jgi:hypothetical protein
MKLTIIETGLVPEPIRGDFEDYPAMFRHMMTGVGRMNSTPSRWSKG